jgi:DUF971 family protein
MQVDARHTPEEIRVRSASRLLVVRYADGAEFELSFEYLRVHSPSAEVKGHGPGQETLVVGKSAVGVQSVEQVGQYALRISFDDGHNTGLYSWKYLRELGEHNQDYWQRYLTRVANAEERPS